MRSYLNLILLKTKRATEQISDLNTRLRAFRDSSPYKIRPEYNSQTGQILYYLGSINETPLLIEQLVGESIHSIRSALDHLVYRLLLVANPSATEDDMRRVEFPFYDDTKETEAQAFRKVKGLRPDAIEAIRKVKPYKGGNDTLWIINRLDNIDKHRKILTSALVYADLDAGRIINEMVRSKLGKNAPSVIGALKIPTINSGRPAKVGDIIHAEKSSSGKVNKNLKLSIDVAFNEPGIIEGKSLLETLQGMVKVVEDIIKDFAPLLA